MQVRLTCWKNVSFHLMYLHGLTKNCMTPGFRILTYSFPAMSQVVIVLLHK